MDIASLVVEKVLLSTVTGSGGAALWLWRFASSILKRLEALERWRAEAYPNEKSGLDGAIRRLGEEMAALEKELKDLIEKEVTIIYRDMRSRTREREEQRTLVTKLSERYLSHEARIAALEQRLIELSTSFATFVREQHEQWQGAIRTISSVEGYLRASMKREPDGFSKNSTDR